MAVMDVDDVFTRIGEYGKRQRMYVVILALGQFAACIQMIGLVFTAAEIPYGCVKSHTHVATGLPQFVDMPQSEVCKAVSEGVKCDTIIFKQREDATKMDSIMTEWRLVCGESYKIGFAQSIYMAGVLTGSLVFGAISDKLGRIRSLYVTVILILSMSYTSGIAWNYNMFVICRFFAGVGQAGHGMAGFVLGSELVGASARSFFGVFFQVFFAIGILVLSLLSYVFQPWRALVLASSVFSTAIFALYLKLPESPRWLLSEGRLDDANAVLHKIAVGNGCSVDKCSDWELKGRALSPNPSHVEFQQSEGISALLFNRRLLVWTLIQVFSWFVNSATYYGLTMASGDLSSSLHMSVVLSGVVELPAYLIVNTFIQRIGRKTLICSLMLVGGLACMSILLIGPSPDKSHFRIAMALLGKSSISGSFAMIWLHSTEVYPTVIRNAGLGACNLAARLGGVTAPFINMIGLTMPLYQFMLFGVLSFVAGLMSLRLPETKDKPMAETVADLDRLHV